MPVIQDEILKEHHFNFQLLKILKLYIEYKLFTAKNLGIYCV